MTSCRAAGRDRQPQDRLVQPDRRPAAAAPVHPAAHGARGRGGALAVRFARRRPLRIGIGMLSIGGTAPAQMERHTENWNLYEETARPMDTCPTARDWRVVGFSTSPRRASRRARTSSSGCRRSPIISAMSRPSRSSLPMWTNPVDWLIDTGTACIGTPDDAVAYVERLVKGSAVLGCCANWRRTGPIGKRPSGTTS